MEKRIRINLTENEIMSLITRKESLTRPVIAEITRQYMVHKMHSIVKEAGDGYSEDDKA
jgi:hypothetical protein